MSHKTTASLIADDQPLEVFCRLRKRLGNDELFRDTVAAKLREDDFEPQSVGGAVSVCAGRELLAPHFITEGCLGGKSQAVTEQVVASSGNGHNGNGHNGNGHGGNGHAAIERVMVPG
jgi:hypothetical protein